MQIYIIPRNRYISVQTQGNSRLNNASIRQKKIFCSPLASGFGWTGWVLLLILLVRVALILLELDRMTYMELGMSAHIQQV